MAGDACLAGEGACVAGGMPGRGHAWLGDMCGGGMCGRGHAWQGGMHGRGVCMPHMPPRHHKIQSVNARAVRILLECILVYIFFLELGSLDFNIGNVYRTRVNTS